MPLDQWLMYHYRSPDPAGLIANAAEAYKIMSGPGKSPWPVSSFLAELFRRDPALLPGWGAEIIGLPAGRELFGQALWLAGTPEAARQLEALIAELPQPDAGRLRQLSGRTPPDLRTMRILSGNPHQSATHLDMLWCAFFATGEDWPVRRLLEVLAWRDDGSRDVDGLTTFSAARWAVASNMRQHPRVLEIVRATVPDLPAASREEAMKLLAEVDGRR